MHPNDEITYLKGVGEKRAKLFEKIGIRTISDLAGYYPRDYIDFTSAKPINEIEPEETAVFEGTVVKKLRPYIGGRFSVFKFVVTDNTDTVLITIFNSRYLFDSFVEGEDYIFFGKFKGSLLSKECQSPIAIKSSEKNKLVPKYRLTNGITSKVISGYVKTALKSTEFEDNIPCYIREEYGLCDYNTALRYIHIPESREQFEAGKKRLVFEELLGLQLGLRLMKHRSRKKTPAVMKEIDISDFYGSLKFRPTNAQMRAVSDCINDMTGGYPMNRLLQGDVGSGKTLVAAALCYFAAKNGMQSALMAPTEILAVQHYNTLCSFLEPFGINVVLLTGSTVKKPVYSAIESGEASVIVGTHAIIQKAVVYSNLGLVITDEQHRFGVQQKTVLTDKGTMPHTLVMSATPIPRTLAFAIYGDLEVSVLDEMPNGRLPIKTYGVTSDYRSRIYNFIIKYIKNGFQAYIVCPLVEENESLSDKKAVTKYYEELKATYFADIPIALLHGKMKQSEKDSAMAAFKSGETKLLISTTVIEVGVDVPNAVVMVVENAEQFGLSQLHQLRGRVGRGNEQSHCILITDSRSEYTKARIDTMVRTSDGFEIANEDLRLRGPGQFFGAQQHGLPELKIADMTEDIGSIQQVQALTEAVLENDPKLTSPENSGLRRLVKNLFSIHEIYGIN